MVVLAAVFAHARWIGLDVAGLRPRVLQGRVEQPQQAVLCVPQHRVGGGQRLRRAGRVASAGQNRPGLCDQVDAAFGLCSRTKRRAVVEEGALVPAAVPGLAVQRLDPAGACALPVCGARRFAALLRQRRQAVDHCAQEPGQPHRLALAAVADAVHAVVPVARADQRQPVHAHGQTAVDGTRGVFVERCVLAIHRRRLVDVLGVRRHRAALQEGDAFIEQRVLARALDVVRQRERQPQPVIGKMGAHAGAARQVPPMLNVTLRELTRRAGQQLAAKQCGRKAHHRHRVLQLVAETEGTTGLVVAGTRPQAAGHGLVRQPVIHERVESRVGRSHLHRLAQLAPDLTLTRKPLFGVLRQGRCDRQPGAPPGGQMPEQERDYDLAHGWHDEGARHRAAGVKAASGRLAQPRGHHQAAAVVVEFAPVAGPLVGLAGRVDAGSESHPRGGSAKAARGVELGAEHGHGVARQHGVGMQVQARGGDAQAVGRGLAQHPFRQRHHAPGRVLAAVRTQANFKLLDGVCRVHAPLQSDFKPGHLLTHAREADAVLHRARARALQGTAEWPDAAVGDVVQQQPFTGGVADGVVGPARDLVQAAVVGPGVPASHFGNMTAETGIGQHVDPWPRRMHRRADHEVVAPVSGRKAAARRRCCRPRLCRRPGQHHRPGAGAAAGVLVALLAREPALHLFSQRPAVGLQPHPRQGIQRVALLDAQIGRAQQPQHRARGRGCGRGIGVGRGLALQQQLQVVLNRCEVGRRLAIDDDQVDALPCACPRDQHAHHQVHECEPRVVVDLHAQDGAVAADAMAPQHALVAAVGRQRVPRQFARGHG